MSVKNRKWLIPVCLLTAIVLGAAIWYVLLMNNIADEVVIEAGSMPLASDFLVWDLGGSPAFVTDLNGYDLTQPGAYEIQLLYNGRNYHAVLRVRDSVAPEAQVQDLTLYGALKLKPEDFLTQIVDATEVTVSYKSEPDMTLAGPQNVVLLLTDEGGNVTELNASLTVIQDHTPPVIAGVCDRSCYPGLETDLLDGISVTDDYDRNPILSLDASEVAWDIPGTYEVRYRASDACGNCVSVTATVTIIDDSTPPVIYGATDRSLCVGSSIAYRSGILVTDDTDPAPRLTIDSSGVDLSTPGTYPLIYQAIDGAGNVTTVEVTVQVYEKLYYFVDESVIYAKADEIISEIITADMSQEDQVWAIYYWIRRNYSFNGWADKVDWKQNAYDMIRTGRGDCYSFFALSKLLFERLGIPNVDVERIRTWEHEGNHYWSVVSVDGGKTWYHYDSTPFLTPDVMCLVTDAVLDEFSSRNWNCYNRDRSTYPATP